MACSDIRSSARTCCPAPCADAKLASQASHAVTSRLSSSTTRLRMLSTTTPGCDS